MHLDELPLPPEGYHLDYSFHYPKSFFYIAKSPPILTSLVLYELAYWGIIGGGVFRGLRGSGVVVFITVVFFSIDIVRGLIQRGVSRWLGYDISFFTLFAFVLYQTFAPALGQFQSRRDALLTAIAPLILFILLGVPLLFGLPGRIGGVLAFFLLVNLSGTAWDLYCIWRFLRMPRGTLLYTESIQELLVFEPKSGKA